MLLCCLVLILPQWHMLRVCVLVYQLHLSLSPTKERESRELYRRGRQRTKDGSDCMGQILSAPVCVSTQWHERDISRLDD